MKKFILLLLLFLSLTSCNIARSKNKTKLSSGDSKASTTAAKYYISSNYHFMMYNPDFMGKAMNYAWQKYSGVTVPARIYPANSCFKKGRYSSSSLSFTNISTKKITQAEIFFSALEILIIQVCLLNLIWFLEIVLRSILRTHF